MNFTNNRASLRLASNLRGALALALVSASVAASATDYYVSTTGNDANAGSQAAPFRTISKAVSLAGPGDNVEVRGGVYRETVTVPRSGTAGAPITIEAYSGETPVINGADVVSGWAYSNGALTAAPGWTLGEGADQIFVDGKPQTEARWPNSTGNLSRPNFSLTASCVGAPSGNGTQVTITDPKLTQASGYWVGAKINLLVGIECCTQSGHVVSSAPGTLTYVTDQPITSYLDRGPYRYFVYGTANAQDGAGEWTYNNGTFNLKPTFGDSASAHTIEVKRRSLGIDLGHNSYININGLRFFASAISGSSSSNVNVNGVTSTYGAHLLYIKNEWTDGIPAISLVGNNDAVTNTLVSGASASGISVFGNNSAIQNNQVRDADYAAGNWGGITVKGTGVTVTDNTLYNLGRFGISHYSTTQASILRNEIYDFGIQTNDLGAIYTCDTDGENTEIAYNVLHDATTGGAGSNGVMLDNNPSNFTIHHNLIYNTDLGIHINPTATNILVANNTSQVGKVGMYFWETWGSGYSNVRVVNNLSNGGIDLVQPTVTFTNHVGPTQDPKFVDSAHHDYRLAAGSPAIDLGTPLSGITTLFGGLLPDAGALEYGSSMWQYGATVAAAPGTPTDLVATSGLRRVNLAWGARTGAASYNVYRTSTSGYGYTLVASGIAATTFEDTGAVPDAMNYYVVTAVNANGESGLSAEAGNTADTQVNVQGLMGVYYSSVTPGNTWNGTVFTTPLFRRIDRTLDFNWAAGSPDTRLNPDGFAVVWTGYITAPVTGTYTLTAKADDCARLTLDGATIVDKFFGAGGNNYATVNLVGGKTYPIKYEYYEGAGAANAQLLWSYPGQDTQVVPAQALQPASGNGVEGNYYNDAVNSDTSNQSAKFGTWVNNRVDANLDFNYPASPLGGVNAEWWSGKWRSQLLAPVDGTYTIQVAADNAETTFINGTTILGWQNSTATRQTTVNLRAGQLYDFGVNYSNSTGNGAMTVSWSFPGQAMQPIPGRFLYTPMVSNYWGLGAQYYSDAAFKNLVSSRIDGGVNFDWTGKSPVTGLPTTGYSVRWNARIAKPTEGNVKFSLDGVGSARLIINGKVWINQTGNAAFSTAMANAIYMRADTWYDIRIEYAPGTNPGKIHLRWNNTGSFADVPISAFRVIWGD